MSANGSDDEDIPGREIAYRLFAAEYDDASLSYAESDEERAPNYVVSPTGARVNRVFAVGTLTEVTAVNDEMVRARVVDPTGAFVVYAGQYQPDALAFLEQVEPPAFVAVTGKARTFEPDDGDRVYTSIRPESIAAVDAETRDRWVVTTAEQTIERVGTYAEAATLDSLPDASDDGVTDALREAGVEFGLAAGIPLARDHYGTTPSYLAALRDCAIEAVEVVANDRDEVGEFTVRPDETGGDVTVDSLASLAAGDGLDIDERELAGGAGDAGGATDSESGPKADTATAATATAGDGPASTDETAAATGTATETETTSVELDESGDEATADDELESDESKTAAASEKPDATESSAAEAGTTDTEETTETGTEGTVDSEDTADDTAEVDDAESESLGDFDAGSDADADVNADADTDSGSGPDPGDSGMYEMDDEEREQIEDEFGTEFTTGTEVDDPGEADIDVPDAADVTDADATAGDDESSEAKTDAETSSSASDDLGAPPASNLETDSAEDDAAESSTAVEADSEAESEPETETEETDEPEPEPDDSASDADATDADEAEAEATEEPETVDLQAHVVDTMEDLDDGDGADRTELIETVAADTGTSEADIEDAIQDALMGGQCYESGDETLKAI
ncbi:hypothetical protein [Natrialba asiatica]|uniref:Rpa-associated protein n=1 Tax=Natrialba asiatica (strain ATCC 700177 / DSM 12278 / JCM 9576 / FERM P-10747 / NBRC 102637 / 172P1) TaxID=29540 RepID=M0APC9_NATA1|nr:hypothetical protein [Natrialba asiatica]ELZ00551.1 hypothetical protein C481_12944 [Natrialba asiatica DSM 12278]